MRKLLTLFLICLSAQASEVSSKLSHLNEFYEEKISNIVSPYLKNNHDFSVVVKIDNKTTRKENLLDGIKNQNIGYLPLSITDYKTSEEDIISIDKINVRLMFYKEISDVVKKDIKTLIQMAFNSDKVDIGFVQVQALKSEAKEILKPEVKEASFSFPDFIKKNASGLLGGLTNIILIFVSILGISLVLKTLSKSILGIVDALKYGSDKFLEAHKLKNNEKEDTEETLEEDIELKKSEVDHDKIEKHFEIVRNCILTNPSLFKNTILENDNFLLTFRMMTSSLIDIQDTLKEVLDKDIWFKIDTLDKSQSEANFLKNLSILSEKLSLGMLKEKGIFASLVDSKTWEQLDSIRPSLLVEVFKEMDCPLTYKFAIDYLPANESADLMQGFEQGAWELIFQENIIDDIELNKKLQDAVSRAVEKQDILDKTISEKDISKMLEAPFRLIADSTSFDEIENIIQKIEDASVVAASIIRSQIWTPKTLELVPHKFLMLGLSTFSLNERAILLSHFDEYLSEQLIEKTESVREKQIITDSLRVLKKRDVSLAEEEKSHKILSSLIDILKEEHHQGSFELLVKEEPKVLDIAS